MTTRESDVSRKHKRVPLEDVDDDFDQRAEARKSGKSKVECITGDKIRLQPTFFWFML
jgi:hypothetical protein